MNDEHTKKRLEDEVTRLNRKFGHKTGSLGSEQYALNVIPTGILSLDYALGTGGWPLGYVAEIFGPPDIGKSSIIGFSAIKSAQAMGKLCGIIAVEPSFDRKWAIKNGVKDDMLVVARPDTGEQAFTILHEWVTDDLVDFIVFDSIGAVLKATETEAEGKPMQGGQSNLITWGIKRILTPAWKNNKSVMLLNQIRADMGSRIPGMVQSPGGNALKHSCSISVQLRPGRERKTISVGTGDERHDLMIGRQMIALVKRNKHTEGTNARAVFNYYQKETEDNKIGIDVTEDVLNTSIKTNIIQKRGGWFYSDLFPEEKLQGRDKVRDFLEQNPEAISQIRDEVLQVMLMDQEGAFKIEKEESEQERISETA